MLTEERKRVDRGEGKKGEEKKRADRRGKEGERARIGV